MEIGNIDEEEKNAYMCLKTSYEHLKTDTTKKLFLLCAVYPEDYSIDPEELVRSAWGLNIYANATLIQEVRVDVLAAIKNLKDSCLLLEDIQDSYIMMHDVVRDVARWIASKGDNGLVTNLGVGLQNEISKQKLEILVEWQCLFLEGSRVLNKPSSFTNGRFQGARGHLSPSKAKETRDCLFT
ncbi:hypothetical protein PTKIN_Ptkin14bG0009300 [Pterospermum kingtungense]